MNTTKGKKQKINLREAKKLMKGTNLADPMKMMDDLQQMDVVKELQGMGARIDDSFEMIQEHVLIVQKNQIEFQKYFEATYKKVKALESKILSLENEILKLKK